MQHLQKTRGGGIPNVPTSTFNLQTFKRSERPIAAKRLWCNSPQKHQISSRSRETTPLPPVSKRRERTSGTARSWSPLQVLPRFHVTKLNRSAACLSIQKRVAT